MLDYEQLDRKLRYWLRIAASWPRRTAYRKIRTLSVSERTKRRCEQYLAFVWASGSEITKKIRTATGIDWAKELIDEPTWFLKAIIQQNINRLTLDERDVLSLIHI